jgi:hypothetical protein
MTDMLKPTADEEERKRLARLSAIGYLGLGMGTKSTMALGEALTGEVDRSEKLGHAARQAAAEQLIRAGERGEQRDYRNQQQQNWQQSYDAQRKEFADQEARLKAKSTEPDPYKMYRLEDSMKGNYNREIADISTTLDATGKVKQLLPGALGRAPSSIEQQSLVILLNKFLDPTSVVREGEFNRVVEAQGLAGRAQNYYDKLTNGKPLSGEMIRDIGVMAALYEQAATARGRQISKRYSDTATNRGLDPSTIIDVDRFGDPGGSYGAPNNQTAPRPSAAPASAPPPTDYGGPPPGSVRRRK